MRDNGHIRLLRVAYLWSMGLGRSWPRATLYRELLVDDGDHSQDGQTYQGSHDLGGQYPAQAERSPSIKDTPQASADGGIDESSRDNANKRAEYKGRQGHSQERWDQVDDEERKDGHQTEHQQVAQRMFSKPCFQPR